MEVSELSQRIEAKIQGAEIYIQDLTGSGDHFEAFVISDLFLAKSRLERQRMVMEPLKDLMNGPLHAITIKTFTKDEWNKQQG